MGADVGRYQGQTLNSTNPLRRDTMLIPAYSYMVLRFVTDNRTSVSIAYPAACARSNIHSLIDALAGLWAFHCHLVWHMAAGLLMQINSLPSKAAQLDMPQAIIDQCKANVAGE